MFKINIKSYISIIASKFTLFLSRTFLKGGSNFPGRVALKIKRDILKDISKNYKVILITGTNGKTTTTSMIFNIIKESGLDAITNNTGANMLPGIVATFIDNFSFKNKGIKYAVIEVDEANLKFITKYISPEIITITNLFRDQLDRYGEVYTTLNKILEGVKSAPSSKLILNGDESLLGKLELKNPCIYYGFADTLEKNTEIEVNADAKFCKFCKAPYKYEFITYNHLGNFFCENCGFSRGDLKYSVDKVLELTPDSSKVIINEHPITLSQSGLYNVYNALCAYAITKELNIDDNIIVNSLENQSSSFGRQEIININDKEVKIILVKNPAGYNQALDTLSLSKDNISLGFFLNDNYADGRDVSWIWDVNFETLQNLNIDDVSIGGIRLYDMAIRLKISGIDEDKFNLCESFDDMTNAITNSKNKKVYLLATYTAMINYRKHLYNKGYIKNLW